MMLERRRWRLGLVLAGVALCAACKVMIAPVEAPLSAPAGFSLPGGAQLPDLWWRALNDPELDRLIERALSRNFTLKQAWDRLAQAQARYRAARAGLFPTLNASVGTENAWRREEVLRAEGAGASGAGASSTDGTAEAAPETEFDIIEANQKSFQLLANYEVDLWGRVRSQRNAAALSAQATEQDLMVAAITLSAQIAAAWYQLQEQHGQAALLAEQIETNEVTLHLIEARFMRGQSNASDVLQQRQLVEARRGDRERTLANIRTLEIALAILVGDAPPALPFAASGELIELPPLPRTGVPAETLAARPDVQSAYRAVQAADQRLSAAIADQYPRLSLTAGYSTSGENWRDLFDNWLASIASNLAAPLLDGGARRAETAAARALAAERFHRYGQTLLEALGEVERALFQEQQQIHFVQSIEKQLALARQVEERTRAQYLNGQEDYLRVLAAQQSVQGLERDLLAARRERIEFRINLCRALAGGWELKPPRPDSRTLAERGGKYPLPL